MVYPGGSGPVLIAGTWGLTVGVTMLLGCWVAAEPEPGAAVELLPGRGEGLDSGAVEVPEAGVRTGVSEPD